MASQQEELESVRNSITSLQAELGTDLLSQLDPRDQREVSVTLAVMATHVCS